MSEDNIEARFLEPTELRLGLEQRIRVVDGIPFEIDQGRLNPPGTKMIVIPNTPHVFMVDRLTIGDHEHNPPRELDGVKVLIAHGVKTGNRWQFVNGQDVVETVNTYDEYARRNNLSPIELLVVCSNDYSEQPDVRIGVFDIRRNIAYAVGDFVHVNQGGRSRLDQGGRVYLDVSVDKNFFGLDQLISNKEVGSQINILGK